MAYYKIDEKKFARMRKEAQMFQNDIVCAVGTDFMRNIAEAENRMIFDILKGVESEATADVAEVKHGEWLEEESGLFYCCTNCGYIVEYQLTSYCPNCGAKMDATDTNVGSK